MCKITKDMIEEDEFGRKLSHEALKRAWFKEDAVWDEVYEYIGMKLKSNNKGIENIVLNLILRYE